MKATVKLFEEKYILEGRNIKNYSLYEVTFGDIKIKLYGRNIAKMFAKCLEVGVPFKLAVSCQNSYKQLKEEFKYYSEK
jgi:hypothetical protein